MHTRLRFRGRFGFKDTDTRMEYDPGDGSPGPEMGSEKQVAKRRKSAARKGIWIEGAPVPQTDTGR